MKKELYYKVLKIILILILTITSCRNSNNQNFHTFKAIVLNGREYPLSESKCPIDILIADTLIIIKDNCDSCFYHIYSTISLKFLGKFSSVGKGPNEYFSPGIMKQYSRIRDSIRIYLYDKNGSKINCVNILEAIARRNYYPHTLNISKQNLQRFFPVNSILFTADSFIVGSTQNHNIKGRFFCFNFEKGNISWEPFYPEVKKTPHKDMLHVLYTSFLTLKPDGEKIAAASLYFKRIDLLDKKCRLIKSVIFDTQNGEPDFSSNQRIPPQGSYFYFGDISANQKNIYVLDRDMKNEKFYFRTPEAFRDTVIMYSTDWEGNLVQKYNLVPGILRVSVDEEDRKIYGINMAAESASLFVYDLDQILLKQ